MSSIFFVGGGVSSSVGSGVGHTFDARVSRGLIGHGTEYSGKHDRLDRAAEYDRAVGRTFGVGVGMSVGSLVVGTV